MQFVRASMPMSVLCSPGFTLSTAFGSTGQRFVSLIIYGNMQVDRCGLQLPVQH